MAAPCGDYGGASRSKSVILVVWSTERSLESNNLGTIGTLAHLHSENSV